MRYNEFALTTHAEKVEPQLPGALLRAFISAGLHNGQYDVDGTGEVRSVAAAVPSVVLLAAVACSIAGLVYAVAPLATAHRITENTTVHTMGRSCEIAVNHQVSIIVQLAGDGEMDDRNSEEEDEQRCLQCGCFLKNGISCDSGNGFSALILGSTLQSTLKIYRTQELIG